MAGLQTPPAAAVRDGAGKCLLIYWIYYNFRVFVHFKGKIANWSLLLQGRVGNGSSLLQENRMVLKLRLNGLTPSLLIDMIEDQ